MLKQLGFLTVALLMVVGCGRETVEPRGSLERGAGIGKTDGSFSCKDSCGKKAPGGCWCDDSCALYGDCCKDKGAVCDQKTTTSCKGACGGQSADGCWCDAQCAKFGDCCDDKASLCDATPADCSSLDKPACDKRSDCKWTTTPGFPGPISMCKKDEPIPPPPSCSSLDKAACDTRSDCEWTTTPGFPGPISMCKEFCKGGEIFEKPVYTDATDGKSCEGKEPICLTKDDSSCPKLTPPPADWCKNGVVETVPDYTISAGNGRFCKIPKLYCLTKDLSSCPFPTPLPEGWCADGKSVDGPAKYIDSSDGMKCKIFQPICLSKDPSAC
jgi:hypothetical protein